MQMIKPVRLEKGDLIAITAPSGAIRDQQTMPRYQAFFEEKGYRVIAGKNCFSHIGYLSADDRARAQEINDFFANDAVKAIFCARGGYGASRMLPFLDYELIRRNPKIFFGFSDVTAIHSAINRYSGLITYHGPNGNVSSGKASCDVSAAIMMAAAESDAPVVLRGIGEKKAFSLNAGRAEGISCGGNLSVIAASLGTAYEPDFDGRILFLEDVNEEPYRIDRMLTQLKQCRVFEWVAGVVFGYFTNCVNSNPDYGFDLVESLRNATEDAGIPVIAGMPFGHEHPTLSIPMGMQCRMDAEKGTVVFAQDFD